MPTPIGTTVSYVGNSSFIGEKLQFHREETPVPSLWETFPIRMKLWSDGGTTFPLRLDSTNSREEQTNQVIVLPFSWEVSQSIS